MRGRGSGGGGSYFLKMGVRKKGVLENPLNPLATGLSSHIDTLYSVDTFCLHILGSFHILTVPCHTRPVEPNCARDRGIYGRYKH